MPILDKNDPLWPAFVKEYMKSTRAWRNKKAKELGFVNRNSFQTVMAREGIKLSDQEEIAETALQETPKVSSDFKIPPGASWEEHLRIIKELDELVAFHQKLPQEVTIKIDTKLPIGIVETADWQLGQFGVDYQSFEMDMDTIEKEPGVFANVGGDTIYNIIQASKIGSSHNQVPIAIQKGLCVLTFKKLLKKLLTLKTGNHEYFDAILTGEDWLGEKAKKLKLIYIKHGGRINYQVGDITYSEFAIHKGRYQSSFNQTHSNKQYQRLHAPWARIITIEHMHIASVESYRYDNKDCVAVRPGTYSVYDDYALQNGFYGAHVCNPLIVLFPDKDQLVAFKDMHEGIKYLRAVRETYVD